MKPDTTMLFGNLFDDVKIISSRLLNFSNDHLNKLVAANGGGAYTSLINLLTPLIAALTAELGDIDTSLNLQKGATLTVDQLLTSFRTTMSQQEGVIANALGGFGTPGYLEFYPHGVSEYTKVNKTTMPTLADRVSTAAAAHTAELTAPLVTTLQTFLSDWNKLRPSQQQQKGDVKNNRTERSIARQQLENGLLTSLHTIAALYPGNILQCSSLFSFSQLFATPRRKHQSYSGSIAAQATIVIQNRTLKTAAEITVRNPDDNATLIIWLAATAAEAPPASPVTIIPGESKVATPSQLGNPQNTFLLLKNISEVNDGGYDVEVVE